VELLKSWINHKLSWLINDLSYFPNKLFLQQQCDHVLFCISITQLLEQFNRVLLEKCSAGNCLLESIYLIDKL